MIQKPNADTMVLITLGAMFLMINCVRKKWEVIMVLLTQDANKKATKVGDELFLRACFRI